MASHSEREVRADIEYAARAIRDRWADAAGEFGGDDVRVSEALAEAALDASNVCGGRVHIEALYEALGDLSNDVDGYLDVADVVAAVHYARSSGDA